MWDLRSQTRDRILTTLLWKLRVLTPGPPGKSSSSLSVIWHQAHFIRYLWLLSLDIWISVPCSNPRFPPVLKFCFTKREQSHHWIVFSDLFEVTRLGLPKSMAMLETSCSEVQAVLKRAVLKSRLSLFPAHLAAPYLHMKRCDSSMEKPGIFFLQLWGKLTQPPEAIEKSGC